MAPVIVTGVPASAPPVIIGRSSSHHTRPVRIFAAELGIACTLDVVRDLTSLEPGHYGGNPALKLPALRTERGTWFGMLNACRELWRLGGRRSRVVWPEDLDSPLPANAQELVIQAMATEVTIIMAKVAGDAAQGKAATKLLASLTNVISWLDAHLEPVLAALPGGRHLSYLEVTLFCFVTHLEFRDVLSMAPYRRLTEHCERFGERSSARATPYHFDP